MTIIGVAPEGFWRTTVGSKPNVFLPMTMMRFAWPGFHHFEDRKFYWAYLFARLKPGVTIGRAEAAINPAYHNIINDVDVPLLQHILIAEWTLSLIGSILGSDQTILQFQV